MTQDILLFALVGFLAQMVDGAISMAYGLTATSVLLSFGISPAVASASVHAAETFTTGASGYAHWRVGNVRRDLVLRLAVPGALGAMVGAYLLSDLEGRYLRPAISLYLLALGVVILVRTARRKPPRADPPRRVGLLGLAGGFLDAIGGGGWGPLVASSLIGRGDVPRMAIGSTCASEFFVTFAASVVFFFTLGFQLWPVILGLVLGGLLAAPVAARITRRLPDRALMVLVGLVIIGLSARNLVKDVGWLMGG